MLDIIHQSPIWKETSHGWYPFTTRRCHWFILPLPINAKKSNVLFHLHHPATSCFQREYSYWQIIPVMRLIQCDAARSSKAIVMPLTGFAWCLGTVLTYNLEAGLWHLEISVQSRYTHRKGSYTACILLSHQLADSCAARQGHPSNNMQKLESSEKGTHTEL
jgi:hypothetical protein